jgi:hypothetical protein
MNAPQPPEGGPWQPPGPLPRQRKGKGLFDLPKKPDTPELHEKMLGLAAMRMAKYGEAPADTAETLMMSLMIWAGWTDAEARAKTARVTAEAATWTAEQVLKRYQAHERDSEEFADEAVIVAEQRKLRVAREAQRRDADEQAAAGPEVVIRSGAWLSAQRFAPVEWAVPGLVPEGVTILGGPPKGGKSWLVLSVALSLSSGTLILGALRNGPARPVLYLALEDSDRRMKQRCAELGHARVPPMFEYVTECHPARVITEIGEWMAARPGQRPVAIIDTWGKIVTPALKGETIYERDYRLGSEVKSLAADHPGASVWVNHHVRKEGAADFIETISGTYGVGGSADTVAVLARKRGEDTGRLHVAAHDVQIAHMRRSAACTAAAGAVPGSLTHPVRAPSGQVSAWKPPRRPSPRYARPAGAAWRDPATASPLAEPGSRRSPRSGGQHRTQVGIRRVRS